MPPYQSAQTPYQPTSIPPQNPPKSRHNGGFNLGTLAVVALVFVALAFAVLAVYYIMQNNKTKTTVDQQVAAAVDAAKAEQKTQDDKANAEAAKKPYRSYTAPAVIGSLSVKFPKTWNVYADENQEAAELDVFMSPEVVRDEGGYTGPYALRIKLEKRIYADAIKSLQSNVDDGKTTAKAAKVSGINGTRFSGQVLRDKKGVLIMLPLRDKTLTIWTEGNDFVSDFENVIKKLKVVP